MAAVIADYIKELIRREDFAKLKMINEFAFGVMLRITSQRDAAEDELR